MRWLSGCFGFQSSFVNVNNIMYSYIVAKYIYIFLHWTWQYMSIDLCMPLHYYTIWEKGVQKKDANVSQLLSMLVLQMYIYLSTADSTAYIHFYLYVLLREWLFGLYFCRLTMVSLCLKAIALCSYHS